MADDIDHTDEILEFLMNATARAAALLTEKTEKNKFVNDSGLCWECQAPLPDKRRWCSPDCATIAEREGRLYLIED